MSIGECERESEESKVDRTTVSDRLVKSLSEQGPTRSPRLISYLSSFPSPFLLFLTAHQAYINMSDSRQEASTGPSPHSPSVEKQTPPTPASPAETVRPDTSSPPDAPVLANPEPQPAAQLGLSRASLEQEVGQVMGSLNSWWGGVAKQVKKQVSLDHCSVHTLTVVGFSSI